jgi:hypothetical protein
METDDVVMVTEVGGVLKVDEVPPARLLVVGVCWAKVESLPSSAASPVVPHVPLVTCKHTSQVCTTKYADIKCKQQPDSTMHPNVS